MKPPPIVRCPTCRAPVEWLTTSVYRPFCSERCRLIDLGQWENETYSVPVTSPTDPDGDTSLS